MIVIDLPQGSQEWLTERAGNVSASEFNKIVTSTGKPTTGKTRETYLYKCAAERITGQPEATYQNDAMRRGNELEPEARDKFEIDNGLFVAQVGLIYLDELRQISCSPDGLISTDSGLEIKCPLPSTHVRYLEGGKLPTQYKQQVQGSLWITGRKSWHFMSYHPAMPPLQLEIPRDEDYITKLASCVTEFNNQVNEIVGRLKG
jgi:putative phage-type endonuclease